MVIIILDAVIIFSLVAVFHDGELPGWGTVIGTSLAVTMGFWLFANFLGPYLGIFSFTPMVAIAGGLLWLTCDLPIKRAWIVGIILFGYKMISLLLLWSLFA